MSTWNASNQIKSPTVSQALISQSKWLDLDSKIFNWVRFSLNFTIGKLDMNFYRYGILWKTWRRSFGGVNLIFFCAQVYGLCRRYPPPIDLTSQSYTHLSFEDSVDNESTLQPVRRFPFLSRLRPSDSLSIILRVYLGNQRNQTRCSYPKQTINLMQLYTSPVRSGSTEWSRQMTQSTPVDYQSTSTEVLSIA